jgi:hypothetical protein
VEELARDVDVELAQQLERGEVALGDLRDGDVEDVDLVLLDEVQDEIERALERRLALPERRERDAERVGGGPPPLEGRCAGVGDRAARVGFPRPRHPR